MPTVLRQRGYRFFFYSDEGFESPHVHVVRAGDQAKFWLDDVISLVYNHGFRQNEISEVRNIISANREQILERWHEYFSR